MAEPLVSIVVNNHNYERFLAEAINSALGQTYPHVEVLVVDDGSTDSSREMIEGYGDAISCLYQSQQGQTAAINRGQAAARGDIVCFLDADDVLLPDTVSRANPVALRSGHRQRALVPVGDRR